MIRTLYRLRPHRIDWLLVEALAVVGGCLCVVFLPHPCADALVWLARQLEGMA